MILKKKLKKIKLRKSSSLSVGAIERKKMIKRMKDKIKRMKEYTGEIWDIVNELDAINHPIDDKEARKVSDKCFEDLLNLAKKLNKDKEDKNNEII